MESGNRKINNPHKANKPADKKPRKKKSSVLWNVIKVFFIVAFIVGIIGGSYAIYTVSSALRDVEPLDPTLIQEKLLQNSVIVDKEGRVLEVIHKDGTLRTVVKFNDISTDMVNAIISVEDKTFWDHHGFNIIRMFGAVKDALVSGNRIGGTSTLTQQLARNVFLFETKTDRNVERKIREAYYAIELEKNLSKKQILEGYLNLVSFGFNSYGIEAAAQSYFSKSAKDLDYIESAMLAGIPKGPSIYPPVKALYKSAVRPEHYIIDDSDSELTTIFNEDSVERYRTVLYLMHENGYITDAQYEAGKNYDIKTKLNIKRNETADITSYFADMVKDEVVGDLMEEYGYNFDEAQNMLYTSGLIIESTIDFNMQKILESHYAREDFTPYYGETTITAVRNFQKKNGLKVDGIAGQETLTALATASGMDLSSLKEEYYSKGNTTDDVVLIKKALFEIGFMVPNDNFPRVFAKINKNGDIVSEDSGKIMMYKQANLLDANDNFIIKKGQYHIDDNGDLVLYKNQHMYFYPHMENSEVKRIQVVLKDTFTIGLDSRDHDLKAGTHTLTDLYKYQGRELIIPDEFKQFDEDYNVVVDQSFFNDSADFYTIDENGNLLISKKHYAPYGQPIIQPQSAMVIIDYHTGELKAVVGGRNISGQRIFNRATNPRQPGSSIKPLSVFVPAIDSGKYTAATVLDDRPSYLLGDKKTRWPVNWYEYYKNMVNYKGLVSLRESLEQSINVTAAKIVIDLGVEKSATYLKKFGITSIVTEGSSNDMNVAALGLGGMTRGISPTEITSAYGAIANQGILNEYHTYTIVKNKNGKTVLEKLPTKTTVIDENVAYIVQDMMKSGVDNGVAKRAKLSADNAAIPVAGKTGTTSNNIDAWFVGYTPYYVAGTWFGNDINIPLDDGSLISSAFWREVMAEIHMDMPNKGFDRPTGITTVTIDKISGKLPTELSKKDPRGTIKKEIFIKGTEPKESDDVHVMLEICKESGKLATANCPTSLKEMKLFVKRPEPYNPEEHKDNGKPIVVADMAYDAPTVDCPIHDENFVDPEKENEKEEGDGTDGTTPGEGDSSEPGEDTNNGADTGIDNGNTELPVPTNPYLGIDPKYTLASGIIVIQRPYPIVLSSGETIILPVNSKIQTDGSVVLPDGSTIISSNISQIPNYSAAELDKMKLTP